MGNTTNEGEQNAAATENNGGDGGEGAAVTMTPSEEGGKPQTPQRSRRSNEGEREGEGQETNHQREQGEGEIREGEMAEGEEGLVPLSTPQRLAKMLSLDTSGLDYSEFKADTLQEIYDRTLLAALVRSASGILAAAGEDTDSEDDQPPQLDAAHSSPLPNRSSPSSSSSSSRSSSSSSSSSHVGGESGPAELAQPALDAVDPAFSPLRQPARDSIEREVHDDDDGPHIDLDVIPGHPKNDSDDDL